MMLIKVQIRNNPFSVCGSFTGRRARSARKDGLNSSIIRYLSAWTGDSTYLHLLHEKRCFSFLLSLSVQISVFSSPRLLIQLELWNGTLSPWIPLINMPETPHSTMSSTSNISRFEKQYSDLKWLSGYNRLSGHRSLRTRSSPSQPLKSIAYTHPKKSHASSQAITLASSYQSLNPTRSLDRGSLRHR